MPHWLMVWTPPNEALPTVRIDSGPNRFGRIFRRTSDVGEFIFLTEATVRTPGFTLIEGRLDKVDGAFPEGDYAMCRFDEQTGSAEIRRDPLGYKPVIIGSYGRSLVAATSLKLLVDAVDVPLEVDEATVADFLLFNMVSRLDRNRLPFRGLRYLPPGTLISIDRDGLKESRYWSLQEEKVEIRSRPLPELEHEFIDTLSRCVADRCTASPVGISLSGGIDSTLIASLVDRLGFEVRAYTMSFEGVHFDEEWRFASILANDRGWKHRRIESERLSFYESEFWDLNLQRSAVVTPSAKMARVMASEVTVGLNGISADNILATELPNWRRNPARTLLDILKVYAEMGQRPTLGFRRQPSVPPFPVFSWIDPDWAKELHMTERWEQFWGQMRLAEHPTHPHLARSLARFDWTERFRGVLSYEMFDPFFDIRMVRFALSVLPFPAFYMKRLQRSASAPYLPEAIRTRKKTMFGDTFQSYLQVANPDEVDGWVAHPQLGRFVARDKVPRIARSATPPRELFHQTKPFLLNEWLLGLDQYRATRDPLIR